MSEREWAHAWKREYLTIPGHMPVKAAAALLGLSEERVLQHVRAGRLPGHKVDGRYMLPVEAVEQFRREPHGRIRTRPAPWRLYRGGARVHTLRIETTARPGHEQEVIRRVTALAATQEHLFPGTMQRYVFTDEATPPQITILLIWKDTELAGGEAQLQQALKAFKEEFADVFNWERARYALTHALAYT